MTIVDDDPYLWLEDITSEQALDWVRQNSETTLAELSGARFERMRAEALEVADSSDRIPGVKRRGEYLYNFWTDAEHPRGLWRRTTLEEYCRDSPDWDVIIDIDALAAAEDENWVWAGADVIEPEYTRALISLSPGGSDAAVVREFDMAARNFVADGFNLPAARSDVSWKDENTVLVGTDFGEGSMSVAGFPLVVKRWRRGTPLDDAETVFTSPDGDMAAFSGVDRTPGYERTVFYRQLDNMRRETLVSRDGELVRLDIPPDAPIAVNRQWLLISLPTGWVRGDVTYQPGTVLVTDFDEFLAGAAELRVVFEPDAHTFVQLAAWTEDHLVVLSLQDVASRLDVMTPGTWQPEPIPGVPDNTDTGIAAIDHYTNEIFLLSSGFDKPPRLLYGHAGGSVREVKSSPARFGATTWWLASTSRPPLMAPAYRISSSRIAIRRVRGRHCCTAMVASRCRNYLDTWVWTGDCGWSVAAPMCRPISEAAPSTDRVGTFSPSAKAGTRWPRISQRWPPISSTAVSRPPGTSARSEPAPEAC